MISILIRTIFIYIILNIVMKIMGKRQIGELEVNELVSALLISELAAIPISDTSFSLLPSIIPILFIAALEVIISLAKNKSATLKKIIEGTPTYVIYKGVLRQGVLRDNRISINELLTEMRIQGIGNIRDVEYGILEQNGKISLLTKQNAPAEAVIIDTKINDAALKETGLDREWVMREINSRNLSLGDIFLMTVDKDNSVYIIIKEENV